MRPNFLYHPFEICISGYSGSGKTTLNEKLIRHFKSQYKVAFFKHDAHEFEFDKEGKDTFKAWHAGASLVSIHDKEKTALIERRAPDPKHIEIERQLWACDHDFAIIEGFKHINAPKLLLLGAGETKVKALLDLREKRITDVLAILVVELDRDTSQLAEEFNLPVFERNDVTSIAEFILNYFKQQIASMPLKGLILAGGKSSRMGQDKGAIAYHGRPQSEHLLLTLKEHCSEVFVSCRSEQKDLPHLKNLPQIHDRLIDMGPMAGVLSAMLYDPNAYWLVLACDLPFVNKLTISHLLERWNPFKQATCYLSQEGLPEPLCGIYSPKFKDRMFTFMGHGYLCSRKTMLSSDVLGVELPFKEALYNANTPDERVQIEKIFREEN